MYTPPCHHHDGTVRHRETLAILQRLLLPFERRDDFGRTLQPTVCFDTIGMVRSTAVEMLKECLPARVLYHPRQQRGPDAGWKVGRARTQEAVGLEVRLGALRLLEVVEDGFHELRRHLESRQRMEIVDERARRRLLELTTGPRLLLAAHLFPAQTATNTQQLFDHEQAGLAHAGERLHLRGRWSNGTGATIEIGLLIGMIVQRAEQGPPRRTDQRQQIVGEIARVECDARLMLVDDPIVRHHAPPWVHYAMPVVIRDAPCSLVDTRAPYRRLLRSSISVEKESAIA